MTDLSGKFKRTLEEAEIISFSYDIRGSRIFLPYGWSIRNRIIEQAKTTLGLLGYEEVHLPNLVSKASMEILDSIYPISDKYYRCGDDAFVAATHEAVFFTFLNQYILRHPKLANLKYYHVGPVFRKPKKALSPYVMGERNSFLEAYAVTNNKNDLNTEFHHAINWSRSLIQDILNLPSIQVIRPRVGNYPFSIKTVSLETLLPLGKTFCSAMVYLQEDIFTSRFLTNRQRDIDYSSIHFGISDNLFLIYLSNLCDDTGIFLHSKISPYHVVLIQSLEDDVSNSTFQKVRDSLISDGLRFHVEHQPRNKSKKLITQYRKKGVPLIALFNQDDSKEGDFNIMPRKLKSEKINVRSLDRVKYLLENNDMAINTILTNRLTEMIVHVSNIHDLHNILNSNMIARFFTKADENNVSDINRLLPVGEVLGFEIIETETGPDIMKQDEEGVLCYASRRI